MTLTTKQIIAAEVLGRGGTIDEAAAEAKVSSRSVDTWKTQEPFKEAVKAIRSDLYQRNANALIHAATIGTAVLLAVAQDVKLGASARVSAARSLLEFSHRAWEIQELTERLAAIEQRLDSIKTS